MRQSFILFFTLLLTNTLFGQHFQVPSNYSFTSKDDYSKYEKAVIQAVDWLENTPLNQETDKRKQVNIFILKYIEGSPTVSVALQGYVTELTKKNPELLIAFLGGWAKYQLEHPTVKDQVKLNTEGVKTIMKIYKLGGAAKDKNVEKLLKLTVDPELENWVKSKLS
jgi:hypothetical protein